MKQQLSFEGNTKENNLLNWIQLNWIELNWIELWCSCYVFSAKPSTLPRNYVTSPTFATNGLSSYSNWRSQPHQKYQSLYTSQTSEGDSIPSTSTESPAMVAMLTEKIENQDKVGHLSIVKRTNRFWNICSIQFNYGLFYEISSPNKKSKTKGIWLTIKLHLK